MSKPKTENARKLETLWSELLAASPSKKILAEVVRLVPELRERAWQAYCDTQPTKNDLMSLLRMREWIDVVRYPALLLVERYGDKDTLLHLMENVGEVAEAAARKLLSGDCERRTLSAVLKGMWNNAAIRTQAADKLLELLEQPETEGTLPDEEVLCVILASAPERAATAGKLLLKGEVSERAQQLICVYAPSLVPELFKRYKGTMSEHVLVAVMRASCECADEAARILLQRSGFRAPFEVLRCHPPLREQAWQKISALPLSESQVAAIKRAAPEYSGRTMVRVPAAPRTAETIFNEILITGRAER